ncbi:hypothetical protein [Bartonella sp. CB178]|uniref:hypothetical protein n=1 Tax=Bartonella sp. CB178 TaxID=3112255 RepID=UPI003FA53BC4
MALAKAFFFGKSAEQRKKTKKTLAAATTRIEIENEINRKSDASVRVELDK